MKSTHVALFSNRTTWLACTAIVSGLILPAMACAQTAGAAPQRPDATTSTPSSAAEANPAPNPTGTEPGPVAQTSTGGGLEEIVVTAQKREQRLQDVPIAITAITQDKLQANRVVNVTDLSGIAPNVTVRPSAGGSSIPAFTARGVTSYGVVPGSDKEFSIYLDGVYIGSSHSLFDLPDIERIEVLRGPQGTLFGRNSTAGAVSVITRDPAGTFGVHEDFTYGNYNQLRSRTSIDTPAVGPFSAYISYVHDERRGDIRNRGAGTFWDRTGPNTQIGAQTSPRYLGSKNQESVFAAVKFEPSDTFKTVYKFDYAVNHFTPEGEAFIGYNPDSPLLGPLFGAIINSQPTPVLTQSSAKRPEVVDNSWTVPGRQKSYGHNLTSELRINDNLSLKNIAAYRYNFVTSASQLSGLGSLVFTPQAIAPYATFVAFSQLGTTYPTISAAIAAIPGIAAGLVPAIGQRFVGVDTNTQSKDRQWSDELQANYTSELLTLTAGGIYFHQKGVTGGPPGIHNTFTFAILPNSGRVPLGNEGTSYNKATSIAGYAQAEVHVTPKIDLVAGGRLTRDRKSGQFVSGGIYVPPAGNPANFTDGTFVNQLILPFTYRKTKFTYSAGANYKANSNTLIYGKYSTGFVSGGSIGGVGWVPETVSSTEGGIKADLLDRKLRTNLALFYAKYKHIQSAQGGINAGRPELGTVVLDGGDLRAYGAELELTLVPVRGLTLNGNLGYTNAKNKNQTAVITSVYGNDYKPILLPKFTSDVSAQYETEPLFDDARFVARVDGEYRSRLRTLSGSNIVGIPAFSPLLYSPKRIIVNTRAGFRNIGPLHLDVSFWTRNLTNSRVVQFPITFGTFIASSSFQPARTYGLDVSMRF